MTLIHARTAAFSGHRTFKMSGNIPPFDGEETDLPLATRIEEAVKALCTEGIDTFLCGMAEGFDLEAAEAVLRMRGKNTLPRLIAVAPYRSQAERFDKQTRERYAAILAEADEVVILAETYHAGCFHARNDYLVAHASVLLCYYNGSKGGTHYTVHHAQKLGLRIINLA